MNPAFSYSYLSQLPGILAYGYRRWQLGLLLACLLPLAATGQPRAAPKRWSRPSQQTSFAGMHLRQILLRDSTLEELNDYGYSGHRYAPLVDTVRLYGYLVCPWEVSTDDYDHIIAIELRTTDSLTSHQLLRALQLRYGPSHFEQRSSCQEHSWAGSGTRLIYQLRPSNNHTARGTLLVVEDRPTPR